MQEDESAEKNFPCNNQFTKSARLLKKKEFQFLFQKAHCFSGKCLLFFWKKRENVRAKGSKSSCSRLGITVTKKFGNAVARNHCKRLVREAFRQLKHKVPYSVDIHVRPKKHFEALEYQFVYTDFVNFFTSL